AREQAGCLALNGRLRSQRGGVPDLDGSVGAGGGQFRPAWAEGHTPHPTGVAFEAKRLLTGGHVPDSHRVVLAARSQSLAVRAERHPPTPVLMALEVNHPAGRHLPDLRREVIAGRREPLAVRTESHSVDLPAMSWKGFEFLSRGCVPDFDHPVDC